MLFPILGGERERERERKKACEGEGGAVSESSSLLIRCQSAVAALFTCGETHKAQVRSINIETWNAFLSTSRRS